MATPKINSVIRVPASITSSASLSNSFFRLWIEFLTPLHGLTFREKEVLAAFIKKRFEMGQSISDEVLLDKVLMSTEVSSEIKKECNISNSYYKFVMSKLRKVKAIVDGRINQKFIPKNLSINDKDFKLLFYFDLNGGNI